MPYYLLFGPDNYRSRQKLEEIKSRFYDANMGDINITQIAGEEMGLERIKQAAYPPPFLANKRLIIIKNFLNKGKTKEQEKVAEILDDLPEHSILVFYEDKDIEKPTILFKKLNKPGRVQKFDYLTPQKLYEWAKGQFQKRGGKIQATAFNKLLKATGSDLWRLSMEIEKLIAYAGGRVITEKDVEFLVKEEIRPEIFKLIDAVAEHQEKRAVTLTEQLLSLGESESYVLSMLAYQFRNLLIIKDLEQQGESLAVSGIHPFALSKARLQSRNFTFKQLEEIYEKILETDFMIKTGRLNSQLALNILISEISHG